MLGTRLTFYQLLLGALIVIGLFALVTGPASARSLPYSSVSHWQVPLTVDTSERCSGALSSGWTQQGNGPSECGFRDWVATTPTNATADYHMGIITTTASYGLKVFVPRGASAFMNYDWYVGSTKRQSCLFNQSSATGWTEVVGSGCLFSILSTGDFGKQFTIHEWSGQVTAGKILAHSAIQLVRVG